VWSVDGVGEVDEDHGIKIVHALEIEDYVIVLMLKLIDVVVDFSDENEVFFEFHLPLMYYNH
jgi:hypothetical protein